MRAGRGKTVPVRRKRNNSFSLTVYTEIHMRMDLNITARFNIHAALCPFISLFFFASPSLLQQRRMETTGNKNHRRGGEQTIGAAPKHIVTSQIRLIRASDNNSDH